MDVRQHEMAAEASRHHFVLLDHQGALEDETAGVRPQDLKTDEQFGHAVKDQILTVAACRLTRPGPSPSRIPCNHLCIFRSLLATGLSSPQIENFGLTDLDDQTCRR